MLYVFVDGGRTNEPHLLGDMEKLHQALEYNEILLKDVAAIQCGQALSLPQLLQNAGIWTTSARRTSRTKVAHCKKLREKLRAGKMVKTFKGLESKTEEIVCFRLIRFKGSSPEEAKVHLHRAPHPLLLSLRSMNAITNHLYGDLANNVTRLLLMSCYSSLDEGMAFDCEHCLRNAFGLEYDEEAKYVMGRDGPEIVYCDSISVRSSENSPEASKFSAEKLCGSDTSASSRTTQDSETCAASTVPRDLFGGSDEESVPG